MAEEEVTYGRSAQAIKKITESRLGRFLPWAAIIITLAGATLGFAYRFAAIETRLKQVEENYTRRDVLLPQLEDIKEDVREIKADVKSLLKER